MIRWEVIIQQWKSKNSIKTKSITSRRSGVRKRERCRFGLHGVGEFR